MDQAETRPGVCGLSGVGLEGEDTLLSGQCPQLGRVLAPGGGGGGLPAVTQPCSVCVVSAAVWSQTVWTDGHRPKFRCLPVFMVVLLT